MQKYNCNSKAGKTVTGEYRKNFAVRWTLAHKITAFTHKSRLSKEMPQVLETHKMDMADVFEE